MDIKLRYKATKYEHFRDVVMQIYRMCAWDCASLIARSLLHVSAESCICHYAAFCYLNKPIDIYDQSCESYYYINSIKSYALTYNHCISCYIHTHTVRGVHSMRTLLCYNIRVIDGKKKIEYNEMDCTY